MSADRRWRARLQWLGATAAVAGLITVALMPLASVPLRLDAPASVLRSCRRLSLGATPIQLLTILLTTLAVLAVLRGGAALVAATRGRYRAFGLSASATVICGRHVTVLPSSRPAAFTAGWVSPRIFISQGALECLDISQLQAVLEHEEHHRRRRDPLRLVARRVLSEALYFVPSLRRLRRVDDQHCELAADAAAVAAAGGDRGALAGALLAFDTASAPGAGIAAARVDRLLSNQTSTSSGSRDPLGTLAAIGSLLALVAVTQWGGPAAGHTVRLCAGTIGLSAAIASTAWRARGRA